MSILPMVVEVIIELLFLVICCLLVSAVFVYQTTTRIRAHIKMALYSSSHPFNLPPGRYDILTYFQGTGYRMYILERRGQHFWSTDFVYMMRTDPIGPIWVGLDVTKDKRFTPDLGHQNS